MRQSNGDKLKALTTVTVLVSGSHGVANVSVMRQSIETKENLENMVGRFGDQLRGCPGGIQVIALSTIIYTFHAMTPKAIEYHFN
jgi:hypothetical protein